MLELLFMISILIGFFTMAFVASIVLSLVFDLVTGSHKGRELVRGVLDI